MVHCGYEPTAVLDSTANFKNMWKSFMDALGRSKSRKNANGRPPSRLCRCFLQDIGPTKKVPRNAKPSAPAGTKRQVPFMVRKVVSEIVSYVNGDLLERNAAKFIPGLSRKELFKKPRHWNRIFPSADPSFTGKKNPPPGTSGRRSTALSTGSCRSSILRKAVGWRTCAPTRRSSRT